MDTQSQKFLITDSAKELADLLLHLAASKSDKRGAEHLADQFQVRVWSSDFFELISIIIGRVESIRKIIFDLDEDEELLESSMRVLDNALSVFAMENLINNWSTSGYGSSRLQRTNIDAIRQLSHAVRRVETYPKVTTEMQDELLRLVAQFVDLLVSVQLGQNDFVRQALIDGLDRFRFRLERLQWTGSGYALDSFRQVLAAYYELEGIKPSPHADPNFDTILEVARKFVQKGWKTLGTVKEISDRGQAAFALYGAAQLTHSGITSAIALIQK